MTTPSIGGKASGDRCGATHRSPSLHYGAMKDAISTGYCTFMLSKVSTRTGLLHQQERVDAAITRLQDHSGDHVPSVAMAAIKKGGISGLCKKYDRR